MQTVLPLLIFLFPLAYSPGPGNMTFAANGGRFGFAATVPASLGYHLATWVVTVAIGLGAMTIWQEVPTLFTALKWAGVGYMLWLAAAFLRAGRAIGARARPISFTGGVVLLVLNPKAYVIIALMFSQFLPSGDVALVLVIATVFTLNNLAAFSLWTFVGDRLITLFRTPEHAHRVNVAFGAALAGVAIWMLIS